MHTTCMYANTNSLPDSQDALSQAVVVVNANARCWHVSTLRHVVNCS